MELYLTKTKGIIIKMLPLCAIVAMGIWSCTFGRALLIVHFRISCTFDFCALHDVHSTMCTPINQSLFVEIVIEGIPIVHARYI